MSSAMADQVAVAGSATETQQSSPPSAAIQRIPRKKPVSASGSPSSLGGTANSQPQAPTTQQPSQSRPQSQVTAQSPISPSYSAASPTDSTQSPQQQHEKGQDQPSATGLSNFPVSSNPQDVPLPLFTTPSPRASTSISSQNQSGINPQPAEYPNVPIPQAYGVPHQAHAQPPPTSTTDIPSSIHHKDTQFVQIPNPHDPIQSQYTPMLVQPATATGPAPQPGTVDTARNRLSFSKLNPMPMMKNLSKNDGVRKVAAMPGAVGNELRTFTQDANAARKTRKAQEKAEKERREQENIQQMFGTQPSQTYSPANYQQQVQPAQVPQQPQMQYQQPQGQYQTQPQLDQQTLAQQQVVQQPASVVQQPLQRHNSQPQVLQHSLGPQPAGVRQVSEPQAGYVQSMQLRSQQEEQNVTNSSQQLSQGQQPAPVQQQMPQQQLQSPGPQIQPPMPHPEQPQQWQSACQDQNSQITQQHNMLAQQIHHLSYQSQSPQPQLMHAPQIQPHVYQAPDIHPQSAQPRKYQAQPVQQPQQQPPQPQPFVQPQTLQPSQSGLQQQPYLQQQELPQQQFAPQQPLSQQQPYQSHQQPFQQQPFGPQQPYQGQQQPQFQQPQAQQQPSQQQQYWQYHWKNLRKHVNQFSQKIEEKQQRAQQQQGFQPKQPAQQQQQQQQGYQQQPAMQHMQTPLPQAYAGTVAQQQNVQQQQQFPQYQPEQLSHQQGMQNVPTNQMVTGLNQGAFQTGQQSSPPQPVFQPSPPGSANTSSAPTFQQGPVQPSPYVQYQSPDNSSGQPFASQNSVQPPMLPSPPQVSPIGQIPTQPQASHPFFNLHTPPIPSNNESRAAQLQQASSSSYFPQPMPSAGTYNTFQQQPVNSIAMQQVSPQQNAMQQPYMGTQRVTVGPWGSQPLQSQLPVGSDGQVYSSQSQYAQSQFSTDASLANSFSNLGLAPASYGTGDGGTAQAPDSAAAVAPTTNDPTETERASEPTLTEATQDESVVSSGGDEEIYQPRPTYPGQSTLLHPTYPQDQAMSQDQAVDSGQTALAAQPQEAAPLSQPESTSVDVSN